MPVEIERKFLVETSGWRQGAGVRICQGYLNRDPQRTVRVRLAGNKAFLTIKGPSTGAVRREFEYEIPVLHAAELFELCDGPVIEKIRYLVPRGSLVWEVDEFLGDNRGLVLAEIELESEDQAFARPLWLGREVTHDPRYFNVNLCIHPFSRWEDAGSHKKAPV